ncbi:hypothetical protein WG66_007602, partial [Moniliophthora roreri]
MEEELMCILSTFRRPGSSVRKQRNMRAEQLNWLKWFIRNRLLIDVVALLSRKGIRLI